MSPHQQQLWVSQGGLRLQPAKQKLRIVPQSWLCIRSTHAAPACGLKMLTITENTMLDIARNWCTTDSMHRIKHSPAGLHINIAYDKHVSKHSHNEACEASEHTVRLRAGQAAPRDTQTHTHRN